jgi:hypothetical protein
VRLPEGVIVAKGQLHIAPALVLGPWVRHAVVVHVTPERAALYQVGVQQLGPAPRCIGGHEVGLVDVKFEEECLPTLPGCSFEINLLVKNHDEISNDLRKRFIITYKSRYKTALQRFMSNLKAGSMQMPGFWAKLFKQSRASFKSVNPVINEMFTLKEVVPFNGYDLTLKLDILGEIKGIGTYYNNYNPDIYMSVSEDTPGKLTDGVIGNIMSKYIL